MARKLSGPTASMVERPIAESMEYRPPPQSQKPNMLAVSMPNLATSAAFVETAHRFRKVCAIDIGNKAERHRGFAVFLKGLVSHHRSKIRAADADIDNI